MNQARVILALIGQEMKYMKNFEMLNRFSQTYELKGKK